MGLICPASLVVTPELVCEELAQILQSYLSVQTYPWSNGMMLPHSTVLTGTGTSKKRRKTFEEKQIGTIPTSYSFAASLN